MLRSLRKYAWGWLSLTLVYVGGCKRGSCEGVACLNGGTCRGGRCDCPSGFSGGRCEVKWTDSWTGTYTVDDRCQVVGLIPQYEASVSASTVYPDVIYFEGFGDIHCQGQRLRVEGRLTSPTAVSIARQSSCDRRYSIEGAGTLDPINRRFTLTYYYRDFQTGLQDTCTAVWVRY
ncbi:MAG: calcium-binding EGF-like domain-containing protein [Bacteroidia bacterium]|nr:calcium-binding EGF-like domain-containing protein [Bacteroidia bacterium]